MIGDETDGHAAWQADVAGHGPTSPDIPLAGDMVEAIARRIGADRLAAWWERQTGRPCGCARRKEYMNKATENLLRWMKLGV